MNVLSLFKTCSGSTGSVSTKELREASKLLSKVKTVDQFRNLEKSNESEQLRKIKNFVYCGSNKNKEKLTQAVKGDYNKWSEKAKTQDINNNQRKFESTNAPNNLNKRALKLEANSQALRTKAENYILWHMGNEKYKDKAPGLAYSSPELFDLKDEIANQCSEIKSLDKTILSTEKNIAQLQGQEDSGSKVALGNSKVRLVDLKAQRARQQRNLEGMKKSHKAMDNNVTRNFYATRDLVLEMEKLLSYHELPASEKKELITACANLKVMRNDLLAEYRKQFLKSK